MEDDGEEKMLMQQKELEDDDEDDIRSSSTPLEDADIFRCPFCDYWTHRKSKNLWRHKQMHVLYLISIFN